MSEEVPRALRTATTCEINCIGQIYPEDIKYPKDLIIRRSF